MEANTRAEFMAGASAALASSLDYEKTLATVARLAVPKLGGLVPHRCRRWKAGGCGGSR